jgi:hypothetical protein
MATAPVLAPGGWVQLNPSTDSPRAGKPSATEQTIGKVTQVFTQEGEQYYQVVWNPGDANPKTAIYHGDQLTALDQQTANTIRQQLAAGTYQPGNLPQPSSNYKSPLL